MRAGDGVILFADLEGGATENLLLPHPVCIVVASLMVVKESASNHQVVERGDGASMVEGISEPLFEQTRRYFRRPSTSVHPLPMPSHLSSGCMAAWLRACSVSPLLGAVGTAS